MCFEDQSCVKGKQGNPPDVSGDFENRLLKAPNRVSRVIFTLGTGTRSKQEFISLLKSNQVTAVVDVRRFPTSRFEHFKKREIELMLEANGVRYFYLGDRLGGYRKGGYQAYMLTQDFDQGITELEKIATQERVAIVCSERFPWRCHRRLIASHLGQRGWQVFHIVEQGKFWKPKPFANKLGTCGFEQTMGDAKTDEGT